MHGAIVALKKMRQSLLNNLDSLSSGFDASLPIDIFKQSAVPIYLVGSGYSLNDTVIGEEFESADTVAINDAVFFDLPYDLLSYELPDSDWKYDLEIQIQRVMENSSARVICRRPSKGNSFSAYPKAFREMRDRIHLFPGYTLPANMSLSSALELEIAKGAFGGPSLDPGFSLGKLILRLIATGRSDIRLMGVDLLSPEHFWQNSKTYVSISARKQDLGLLPEHEVHNTQSSLRNIQALGFLQELQKICEPKHYSLRVSRESPLSAYFKTWN